MSDETEIIEDAGTAVTADSFTELSGIKTVASFKMPSPEDDAPDSAENSPEKKPDGKPEQKQEPKPDGKPYRMEQIRRPMLDMQHGRALSWEGLPYRGAVMDFKSTDSEERLPQLRHCFHTQIFDLSVEADRTEYSAVLDKTASQLLFIRKEIHRENSNGAWSVWLTWDEPYYVPPTLEARL